MFAPVGWTQTPRCTSTIQGDSTDDSGKQVAGDLQNQGLAEKEEKWLTRVFVLIERWLNWRRNRERELSLAGESAHDAATIGQGRWLRRRRLLICHSKLTGSLIWHFKLVYPFYATDSNFSSLLYHRRQSTVSCPLISLKKDTFALEN